MNSRDWRVLAGALALKLAIGAAAIALGVVPAEIRFLLAAQDTLPSPWGGFLAQGGAVDAFPYGLPALLAYSPAILLAKVAGPVAGQAGVLLITLAFDMATLVLLCRLAPPRNRTRLLVLYGSASAGLYLLPFRNPVIALPIALLVAAFHLLDRKDYRAAAISMGVAIGTFPMLGILLPLFGLYFYGRGLRRRLTLPVMALVLLPAVLLLLPLADDGFRHMLLAPGAAVEPLTVSLELSSRLPIFLFPVAYAWLLFAAWRIQRFNTELLVGLSALAILAMLALSPRSSLWALTVLPFLAAHAARAGGSGLALYISLSVVVVLMQMVGRPDLVDFAAIPPSLAGATLTTLSFVGVVALAVQVARRWIVRSDFYQATRSPFAIGVSGDSGAGKDTLVEGMIGMVGTGSAAHVSGDDYHLWDRNKPMWKALTHLDPRANDLPRFQQDVATLIDRRYIEAPHYNHRTGRMTKPLRTNPAEFVFASGLHALWSPALRELYDLTIFLDIDDGLRRYLKVRRDTAARGHSVEHVLASLDRRAADRERFIEPQAEHADIIVRLEPLNAEHVKDYARKDDPPLRLVVRARPGIGFGRLARMLAAIGNVLATERHDEAGYSQLCIEGELTSEDIGATARLLAPDVSEFLQRRPQWRAGMAGVMQLVILTQVDRLRMSRWGGK